MSDRDKAIEEGISRRDVLKAGMFTAAALSAPLILNPGRTSMAEAPKSTYSSDLLIIGSGFAGTFAALEARKNGLSVIMVDKGVVGWSGMSPWASDSRPFDAEIYDRDEWHLNLAMNTEYVNDRVWLDIFMDESLDIFYELQAMGAHETKPFERGTRVFRSELEAAGVAFVERTMVTSLLKDDDGRVAGAVGFTYDDSREASKAVVLNAGAVVLCTGAGSYKSPGFPIWGQTFDGDAMAYEAGATIVGKEFHDTHPTFAFAPAAAYEGWKWAQEVKGAYVMVGPPNKLEGGLTLGNALNVYQNGVDRRLGVGPGGEPPPVPGAPPPGAEERERNRKYLGKGYLRTPGLHLDMGGPPEAPSEEGDGEKLGHRVGGATAGMGVHKSEGILSSDYSCAADGVEGLYAAGDALGSMLCGSLYPGRGFSSYGSAIQGRRAARSAVNFVKSNPPPKVRSEKIEAAVRNMWAPRENAEGYSPEWLTVTLQNTMTPFHVLYIKERRRLDGALASIEFLRKHCVPRMIARDGHELRMAHEVKNMLLNAEMKLRAGLYREESRGTHFREDFPVRNDKDWFCWVTVQQKGGEMNMGKQMLPEKWKPSSSNSYRENYPRVFPGEDEYLRNQRFSI
ncbi:FAD-binding protein [Haliea sp. E1-2-M8]|uniref:FAD-dependent oxidoreductase n=1 Tax=Haliea sp. E1-2-M8 TaxID=3064706 RepID=UPI0027176085|nr:FAD-binding protein [Haliea sp. E1-2-M8]MDO8863942.1 FAD-binding protein [Haliea sp. E1-2-M8]